MSVSIGIILVVVTAVIAAIALAPAVAPRASDQTADRGLDGQARRGDSNRRPARRRLTSIPPQQTGDRRRTFG
ncbi:hypothetical protein OG756_36605 [Streptomyces sp. NBC_01310]|uniref:hypothetical protein n=1 Tax=Streptomyces sp. NBC_01310 TaxID=2903820 RepID=UPI0035B63134|nr:hypothetical protein OG756_36605 [Streptomyces sp. NBC_01310]